MSTMTRVSVRLNQNVNMYMLVAQLWKASGLCCHCLI